MKIIIEVSFLSGGRCMDSNLQPLRALVFKTSCFPIRLASMVPTLRIELSYRPLQRHVLTTITTLADFSDRAGGGAGGTPALPGGLPHLVGQLADTARFERAWLTPSRFSKPAHCLSGKYPHLSAPLASSVALRTGGRVQRAPTILCIQTPPRRASLA